MSSDGRVSSPVDGDPWLQPHRYQPERRFSDMWSNPWHYTNRSGLEGILASHVLWATESGGLNDPSEVTRAAENLLATWQQSLDRLVPAAPTAEADEWLQQMTTSTLGRRFFFVSASLDGDKLQHWNSYAGGKGYAIEIDFNAEFRMLGAKLLFRPGFAPYPWWRSVTYGDYDTGQSPRGGSLFFGSDGIMEHVLDEFAARARGRRPDEPAFWEHLEASYVMAVCFNKHAAYAAEEEARLAFVEPPFEDFVQTRGGGFSESGKTAYLRIAANDSDPYAYSVSQAERLPIKSVMVGPRYGKDLAREIESVAALLSDHGYAEVPITASTTPYRG